MITWIITVEAFIL